MSAGRAWIQLMALGAITTGLAQAIDGEQTGVIAGAAILVVAFLKSRIVLKNYLGLALAPSWQGGFDLALGAFVLLALTVYLVPTIMP